MTTVDMCVGTNLRLFRISTGRTLEQISRDVGVSKEKWVNWEAARERVGASDMYALKLHLDLNPSDLFAGVTS